MHATEITRYTYYLNASKNEKATVYLYGNRNQIFAVLHFVEQAVDLPSARESGDRRILNYPWSELGAVIDMLRNEGPVYLTTRDDGTVALSTGYEPVGEGEHAA